MCVAGVRKLTFSTPIVTTTEKVTRIIVNRRYWVETLGNRLVGMINLAEKGHRERSRGDDLGKEEEEHSEGEQDGDGE